ncbi:pre-piRNA 3'-exonuclease trimmer [Halyomorpha halys]|uniref:pre-piRNA 3'-exonuclease trimmer n=1 Tax=Halyomorpha halys TaxID=286706 RepID=UPI0006D4F3B7|nr:pre-piRNA 3'-exonuclease trimmer-like [Halyomorpha halys]
MVEATRKNFEDVLNELQYEIKNCSFFSLDCEFTSLPGDKYFENSFFDSGEDRFNKIRNNLDHALILQVGITPFKYNRDLKHYRANPFKFYVFPRVFGPFDVSFLCKSATVQFLCNHKFDFNKGFYQGISYLNRNDKESILKLLYNGKLLSSLEENFNHEEINEILRICDLVNKWTGSSSKGSTIDFPIDPFNDSFNYLLQERIRMFNNQVWTYYEQDKIVVKNITKHERLEFEEKEKLPHVKEKFIDSLLGFTKVFNLLASSKKPLVGHNLYFDLLIMYHQFYEDLPANYFKYKENLNRLFPCIFDTKFLSYQLHRTTKQTLLLKNSLGSLYELFQDVDTRYYQPYVQLDPKSIYSDSVEQKKHDAGWDSYMTGFAFLKLADEFAQIKRNIKVTDDLTFIELLASIKDHQNKINIARAKVSYVNLQGKDPPSTRPPLLHVERIGKQLLTKLELDVFFKKYEPVHKKLLNNNSALIAVPNFSSFKTILNDFHNSELLKVEKYSIARHNASIRACFAVVIIVPLVLAAWAGYKFK